MVPMPSQDAVFLSAVSSEFEGARNALANYLHGHRKLTVLVQRSFRQDSRDGTLLGKLHDDVASCGTVIFLIGKRSGAGFPTPAEAAPYQHFLPDDIAEASYTQWEYFFAKGLGKACRIYIATPDFPPHSPDPASDDRPDLQAVFVRHQIGRAHV